MRFAEMEHEGHAAAEAANEQEAAEHFLPLIGLAAKFVLPKLAGMAAKKLGGAALKKIGGKLLGRVGGQLLRRVAPRLIRRVTPQLTRGVANVTRTLFRNRSTRPLHPCGAAHRAQHGGAAGLARSRAVGASRRRWRPARSRSRRRARSAIRACSRRPTGDRWRWIAAITGAHAASSDVRRALLCARSTIRRHAGGGMTCGCRPADTAAGIGRSCVPAPVPDAARRGPLRRRLVPLLRCADARPAVGAGAPRR